MAALASLTEMYTDSEGEEGPNIDEDDYEPIQPKELEPQPLKSQPPPEPAVIVPPPPPPTSNAHIRIVMKTPTPLRIMEAEDDSKLVSYMNETMISDDEFDRPIVTRDDDDNESLKSESPSVIHLPLEPVGKCSPELQQKIASLTDKMKETGNDMNSIIQLRKSFRNPSIYEKLIQFCGINEFGTNYPPQIYDPLKWNKNSYYDELALVQKADMDRRERERREKTKVEFLMGTAKKPSNGSTLSATGNNAAHGSAPEEEVTKKRKSKWDQVGLGISAPAVRLPAGIVTLTTSTTGTKSTVISAFGSLPKKPKN